MELLKGFLLIALVALTSASLQQSRIIGGDAAASYQFTYQVSLRFENIKNYPFCSGAILSNRWILTANRCVNDKKIDEYYVVYGARRISEPGQKTKIAKVINHPEYNPELVENDLALLFTKSKMVFIQNVVDPIALPTQASRVDDVAMVSGWAITERVWPSDNNYSDNMHFKITKLIPLKECRKSMGPKASNIHGDKIICTKSSLGRGDSGNPLVSKTKLRQLIGIVSSINIDEENIPDVYTAVFPYVSWIKKYINK